MKTYTITLYGKEIAITQNEDGSFNKPDFILELEKQGTALKPAHEPICMARKPLSEKTVADNCLKWGTGGINIDGSRVEIPNGDKKVGGFGNGKIGFGGGDAKGVEWQEQTTGRFPANLLHDGSEEVKECFPETGKGSDKPRNRNTIGSFGMPNDATPEYSDSGSASRFFKSIIYQAKASKSERNKGCEGLEEKRIIGQPSFLDDGGYAKETGKPNKAIYNQNHHPTVKPIALMEYLIKMITPKGGVVLDPFMGSGSTGIGSILGGFNFIGIEREIEYIEIARARIEYASRNPNEFLNNNDAEDREEEMVESKKETNNLF